MFVCEKCHENKSVYDYKTKTYTCGACGYSVVVKPRHGTCYACGAEYMHYSWHDPSCCTKCHKSFID